MCGRIVLSSSIEAIAAAFGIADPARHLIHLAPRYNIKPGEALAIVRTGTFGDRELVPLTWGFIPREAKVPGRRQINARAETVDKIWPWRHAFRERRCLVVVDGFYEPEKYPGTKKTKQQWFFRLKSKGPMALAGLWDQWHEGKPDYAATCAVITTTPNELIASMGHERMPVIVKERDYTRWLDPKIHDRTMLDDMLVPYPSDLMEGWPVGTRVNNPKLDDASLIAQTDDE